MTFKELLTKQINSYKPGWKIPKVLLAIDPGETTGYSIFKDGELLTNGVIDWNIQVYGYNYLVDIMKKHLPNIVVCENFRLYAAKASALTGSQFNTVKTIGNIEILCERNNIPIVKQMAHMAKGFCTDDKLKEWGYYKKVNKHSRDSIRHATYFLLFSKEVI
mgnify:CR=1 FL=1